MIRLLLALVLATAIAAPLSAAPKKATAKKPVAEAAGDEEGEEGGETASGKPALAPGELPIFARSAMVLDGDTGGVLFEKNADALEYPASATKILTALLVIEKGDLDQLVTIEKIDTQVEPSALYIKPGEQYPRRTLLYALLLKSANDVAMALARDHSGSVAKFAEAMTERAHQLGAESSHFKNPHGLHDPHHYTTARDLAKIGHAAMKNPLFREIVATPEIWMRKADEWIFLKNHNRLLARMPGCIGVKTGYTRAAQQVLVSAATREGKQAISVVLHTNKPGIWDDSELLLKHGLTKLTAPPVPVVPADPSVPAVAPAASPTAPTPVAPPPAPAEKSANSQIVPTTIPASS